MRADDALAGRYARALVAAARGAGADLDALVAAAGRLACAAAHPEVSSLLGDPTAPAARVAAVLGRVEGLPPLLGGLLSTLGRRRRLALLPAILDRFRRLADEARGISPAEITTAVEVPADLQPALVAAVERLSRRRVRPAFRVDPEILGGLAARVGDRLFDASFEGALRRFQEAAAG